ncbi:MAG: mandelate racemase/muconate lactonizing enzyme family protein [Pseudomonadota bacterium]
MTVSAVTTYLLPAAPPPDGWSSGKTFLFAKLEADDGQVGWGEAYALPGRERAIEELVLALGRAQVIGRGPSPRAFRHGATVDFAQRRTGIDFTCAASALEMALWDLRGKQLGQPVHVLLGGALREAVPLYANTYSDRAPSMDQVVARIESLVAQGFEAVKIYPLLFGGLAAAETFVGRVRDLLGPDRAMMIDLAGQEDAHLALAAGRRFAPYDPFWFEEPVSSDDLETLAEIRAKLCLRLVSGERHGGIFRFREMLERRAADALNPDIAGCGGILEMLDIAAMAEAHSVQLSPHNYNSNTVAFAAMLQVAALVPNLLNIELYPDFTASGERFATLHAEIGGSHATIPQAPGLGVTVDEAALAALAPARRS